MSNNIDTVFHEEGAIWIEERNDYINGYLLGSQIILTKFMRNKNYRSYFEMSYCLCIKEEFLNLFLKTFFTIGDSSSFIQYKAEWFEAFIKPSLLPYKITKDLLKEINSKGICCTIVKKTETIIDIITEPIWLTDEDKDILLNVKL